MKKNDWILTAAVGLYSFLFYQQTPGINFVLFNIALIILLGIKDNALVKKRNWLLAATGSLLSACCIAWYGNGLSVIANIVSLSLLSSLSLNQQSSVVLSLLFSCYSYLSSPIFMFLDRAERKKRNNTPESNTSLKRVWLVIIPLLITFIFFFMYRASNPLFNDLAKNINLDFISWGWITFTLGGFILLYGFFYHKKIKALSAMDENASNDINPNNNSTITLFGKELATNDEDFSGKVMFALLNALILVVNGLDINFLFLGGKLPKGVSYSEFVHQGTGILITSIIIAIAIILFYFRGALNFYEKSKTIKFLAYFWIIQNGFMLVSTGLRNDLYIGEFGLTYKRIGVYIYLFLCVLGLITTFIKIMKVKSNNYLFRINGWLFYGVLVISCFFNWDAMITDYNITYPKWLEKNYLLKLSDTNLPQLFVLQQDTTIKHKEFALKKEDLANLDESTYDSTETPNFEAQLGRRLYFFMSSRENLNWKSWYYDNSRIYNDLLSLNENKKIKTLKLSGIGIQSLEPMKQFNNIIELNLSSNRIGNLNELHYFTSLKTLDLRNNKLLSLKGIEILTNLEYLNVSENRTYDYTPLYKLHNLKELYINNLVITYQYEALQKNLPNTKVIKG